MTANPHVLTLEGRLVGIDRDSKDRPVGLDFLLIDGRHLILKNPDGSPVAEFGASRTTIRLEG